MPAGPLVRGAARPGPHHLGARAMRRHGLLDGGTAHPSRARASSNHGWAREMPGRSSSMTMNSRVGPYHAGPTHNALLEAAGHEC